jgi:hypothetical protein
MIKSCIQDFDGALFVETDISSLEPNASVKVTGTMSVTKKVGKQGDFLSITMTKKGSLLGATIFADNPLYELLAKFDGKRIDGSIYGVVYVNGKYVNINVANVEYFVDDKPDASELKVETSQRYIDLRDYADEINDKYLKAVVLDVYNNTKIMNRFLSAPASEFSAYSYLGGLAKMTEDICFVTVSMDDNKELATLLGINKDMLITAALLCNIGRAYMYDIDKDGNFAKNEYGILDSDTSLTRDAVKQSMRNLAALAEESVDAPKPKNVDVVKELIHVLDTSKSQIGFQPANAPRTRTASLFASIVNMVNATGTFDKLENSNVANEKLVKAFEGGKYYFLPEA